MNYGHFFLTLLAGIAIGVCAATSNIVIAFAALAALLVLALILYSWMDYCDRNPLSTPQNTAGDKAK